MKRCSSHLPVPAAVTHVTSLGRRRQPAAATIRLAMPLGPGRRGTASGSPVSRQPQPSRPAARGRGSHQRRGVTSYRQETKPRLPTIGHPGYSQRREGAAIASTVVTKVPPRVGQPLRDGRHHRRGPIAQSGRRPRNGPADSARHMWTWCESRYVSLIGPTGQQAPLLSPITVTRRAPARRLTLLIEAGSC